MTRVPASANDIESLVARRAQLRSDSKPPLRGAERQEPRMTPASQAQDADIQDVVQKFEQVYAQFTAEQRERKHDPGLAELASAAFEAREASPARDTRESRSDTIGTAMRIDVAAVPSDADAPIEHFELPQEDSPPQIARRTPTYAFEQKYQHKRRRLWPMALGGGALALAIGIGVGYLAVPRIDSSTSRARIEPSQHGGTQLRIDYELKSPPSE
jgi:hypothetical protein